MKSVDSYRVIQTAGVVISVAKAFKNTERYLSVIEESELDICRFG